MEQTDNMQAVTPAQDPAVEATTPTRRGRTTAPSVPTVPKKRTPSVKARALEELDTLDAKKMTPAESVTYINALREVIMRQQGQNDELQKVAKSSFEQFRNADDTLNKVKSQANADIALAKQIINTAAKSIALIGGQN